ncbi:hypothetical protein BT67DRAFT_444904 [Trichocladium antarcticum]|uniref:Uncharacterized protein n=1 Tax=Trichocladium antarcticum TaxID=1450529 RepID=A0AAN6ZBA4_9PEZI|nr:hypothetical protein BT67DRAFT_444904 [Trichocladium antarcticum]
MLPLAKQKKGKQTDFPSNLVVTPRRPDAMPQVSQHNMPRLRPRPRTPHEKPAVTRSPTPKLLCHSRQIANNRERLAQTKHQPAHLPLASR